MIEFFLVVFWQLSPNDYCQHTPTLVMTSTHLEARAKVRELTELHESSLCLDQVRIYKFYTEPGRMFMHFRDEHQMVETPSKDPDSKAIEAARAQLKERLDFEKMLDEAEVATIERMLADPSIDEPMRGILEDDLAKKRNKAINKAIKGLGGK